MICVALDCCRRREKPRAKHRRHGSIHCISASVRCFCVMPQSVDSRKQTFLLRNDFCEVVDIATYRCYLLVSFEICVPRLLYANMRRFCLPRGQRIAPQGDVRSRAKLQTSTLLQHACLRKVEVLVTTFKSPSHVMYSRDMSFCLYVVVLVMDALPVRSVS